MPQRSEHRWRVVRSVGTLPEIPCTHPHQPSFWSLKHRVLYKSLPRAMFLMSVTASSVSQCLLVLQGLVQMLPSPVLPELHLNLCPLLLLRYPCKTYYSLNFTFI